MKDTVVEMNVIEIHGIHHRKNISTFLLHFAPSNPTNADKNETHEGDYFS